MHKLTWGGTALLPLFALAASISPASAADLSVPAPVPMYSPTPVVNWTGFYAGVHGGGGWGDQIPDTPAVFSISGPYVGGQLGYNWQVNQIVFGVEADASWSGIHGKRVSSVATTTEDVNWLGTIRGRIGWAAGDGSWFPYVTGGWAWANATRTNDAAGPQTFTASHNGWTVGAGIEKQFADHWTLKGEYKYIALGSSLYNWPIAPTTASLNIHTFEVGLNYRF